MDGEKPKQIHISKHHPVAILNTFFFRFWSSKISQKAGILYLRNLLDLGRLLAVGFFELGEVLLRSCVSRQ